MAEESKPFQSVAIAGAGYMGAQIGLQCAVYGYPTWMFSRHQETLDRARQMVTQELGRRLEAGTLTEDRQAAILGRLRYTTDLREAVSGADLVIESVSEKLEIKRAVFAQLDQLCPPRTILATNSSSIRISLIEDATSRRDRVLNLHFYGPVWRTNMVELMRGTATSDETIESVRRFAKSIGVVPLVVLKESTGFIYNRVWRAIKRECLHLVDDGVATFEDVDRAWMISNGSAMGPFGKMDVIGLDVVRDIEMVYYRESGDERDAPPKLLLDKIERGELGVKTGKGFYSYPNPAYQTPGWLQKREE